MNENGELDLGSADQWLTELTADRATGRMPLSDIRFVNHVALFGPAVAQDGLRVLADPALAALLERTWRTDPPTPQLMETLAANPLGRDLLALAPSSNPRRRGVRVVSGEAAARLVELVRGALYPFSTPSAVTRGGADGPATFRAVLDDFAVEMGRVHDDDREMVVYLPPDDLLEGLDRLVVEWSDGSVTLVALDEDDTPRDGAGNPVLPPPAAGLVPMSVGLLDELELRDE